MTKNIMTDADFMELQNVLCGLDALEKLLDITSNTEDIGKISLFGIASILRGLKNQLAKVNANIATE